MPISSFCVVSPTARTLRQRANALQRWKEERRRKNRKPVRRRQAPFPLPPQKKELTGGATCPMPPLSSW